MKTNEYILFNIKQRCWNYSPRVKGKPVYSQIQENFELISLILYDIYNYIKIFFHLCTLYISSAQLCLIMIGFKNLKRNRIYKITKTISFYKKKILTYWLWNFPTGWSPQYIVETLLFINVSPTFAHWINFLLLSQPLVLIDRSKSF